MTHTPGFVSNPVWMRDADAPPATDDNPTLRAVSLHPAPGGSTLLVVTFPPDSVMAALEFDVAASVAEHLAESPGIADRFEPAAPGMHRTDTIDHAIVLSGEITLELDDGATRNLAAHDVVIQQGTRHAWRNTGPIAATVAFCLIGAWPKACQSDQHHLFE